MREGFYLALRWTSAGTGAKTYEKESFLGILAV